jgi:hypothetical protein
MRDETVMQLRIGDLWYVFRRNDAWTITAYSVEDGREQPVLERASLEKALADVLAAEIGEEVEVHYI